MKTFLVYLLIFMIVIFILPALCTRQAIQTIAQANEEDKINSETVKIEEVKTYDYSKYGTIKLYHTQNKQIEELPLDEYLYGVVSAEMPASYDLEALKAQAVVARTYTLYQIINGSKKHGEGDICDSSSCCQAWISKEDRLARWKEDVREDYWNKIVEAVNKTSGRIITYEGKAIDAFFHSNSGGMTETASNVWGGKNFPYLQSVETSGESDYNQYNSEVKLSKDDLIAKLKEKYSDIEINFDNVDCIKILDYTESGRVKTIKFGNKELARYRS